MIYDATTPCSVTVYFDAIRTGVVMPYYIRLKDLRRETGLDNFSIVY